MSRHYEPQARDPRRTYDAGNRWDGIEPIPHTGYQHGYVATAEIEARVLATASEIVDRAAADGADIGSVDLVAASIRDRIRWERERMARADHVMFHAGRTTGDPDLSLRRAPEPFERVRARTRTERSNRGNTIKRVTVHGRAYVIGAYDAERSPALAMTPERLAHAIATAPATADGGRDAVALAMLADAAYPDIPRLEGGDVMSWHRTPISDEVLYRQPRRGWPARYKLRRIVPRSGEPSTRGSGPLLASADRPDMAWRGHTLHPRPMTVRERRATVRKRADEHAIVPDAEPLADRLAVAATIGRDAGRPYRVTWEWRGMSGAVTVSRSDSGRVRYAVSGLPEEVKGYETPDGMARRVARIVGADAIPTTSAPRVTLPAGDRIESTPAGNRYRRTA